MDSLRTSTAPFPQLAAILVVMGFLSYGTPGEAAELTGSVTDGPTDTPIPGATVRVVGGSAVTTTDEKGRWSLDLPPGRYDLAISAEINGQTHSVRLVRQQIPQYKPAHAHLYVEDFINSASSPGPSAPELPADRTSSGHPPATQTEHGPERWTNAPGESNRLTLPDMPDTTIRVARRQQPDEGCANNPIVAIESMDLDTYVRGVLPPEIGVFRNLDNVDEVYRAFALAAKSYGLWFTLHYDATNRRTVDDPMPPNDFTWFHIDDTACNQRYSDNRLTITNEAAADVAGELLARESNPDTLDKYEYAASCGGHSTRPAYQQSLVQDDPSTTACVGDWCGHQNCAGHEDHPEVAGDDRCLVRGICQWGAAEWAKAGRDYNWILDHYQPNLTIRPIDEEPSVSVTGYIHTDPENVETSGIEDARVTLESGRMTRTDADGRYIFTDVPLSLDSIEVTATKSGYTSNSRTKTLVAGERNWVSIHLREETAADAGSATDTGDVNSPKTTFGPLVSPAHEDVSGTACSTGSRNVPPARAVWICLFVLAATRLTRRVV